MDPSEHIVEASSSFLTQDGGIDVFPSQSKQVELTTSLQSIVDFQIYGPSTEHEFSSLSFSIDDFTTQYIAHLHAHANAYRELQPSLVLGEAVKTDGDDDHAGNSGLTSTQPVEMLPPSVVLIGINLQDSVDICHRLNDEIQSNVLLDRHYQHLQISQLSSIDDLAPLLHASGGNPETPSSSSPLAGVLLSIPTGFIADFFELCAVLKLRNGDSSGHSPTVSPTIQRKYSQMPFTVDHIYSSLLCFPFVVYQHSLTNRFHGQSETTPQQCLQFASCCVAPTGTLYITGYTIPQRLSDDDQHNIETALNTTVANGLDSGLSSTSIQQYVHHALNYLRQYSCPATRLDLVKGFLNHPAQSSANETSSLPYDMLFDVIQTWNDFRTTHLVNISLQETPSSPFASAAITPSSSSSSLVVSADDHTANDLIMPSEDSSHHHDTIDIPVAIFEFIIGYLTQHQKLHAIFAKLARPTASVEGLPFLQVDKGAVSRSNQEPVYSQHNRHTLLPTNFTAFSQLPLQAHGAVSGADGHASAHFEQSRAHFQQEFPTLFASSSRMQQYKAYDPSTQASPVALGVEGQSISSPIPDDASDIYFQQQYDYNQQLLRQQQLKYPLYPPQLRPTPSNPAMSVSGTSVDSSVPPPSPSFYFYNSVKGAPLSSNGMTTSTAPSFPVPSPLPNANSRSMASTGSTGNALPPLPPQAMSSFHQRGGRASHQAGTASSSFGALPNPSLNVTTLSRTSSSSSLSLQGQQQQQQQQQQTMPSPLSIEPRKAPLRSTSSKDLKGLAIEIPSQQGGAPAVMTPTPVIPLTTAASTPQHQSSISPSLYAPLPAAHNKLHQEKRIFIPSAHKAAAAIALANKRLKAAHISQKKKLSPSHGKTAAVDASHPPAPQHLVAKQPSTKELDPDAVLRGDHLPLEHTIATDIDDTELNDRRVIYDTRLRVVVSGLSAGLPNGIHERDYTYYNSLSDHFNNENKHLLTTNAHDLNDGTTISSPVSPLPDPSIATAKDKVVLSRQERFVFDHRNIDELLAGVSFLSTLTPAEQESILKMNPFELTKCPTTGKRIKKFYDKPEMLIDVHSKIGHFDLTKEYGVPSYVVEALDLTFQLAMAAGLEALLDAGFPILTKVVETVTAPNSTETTTIEKTVINPLPKQMRSKTGIVFVSSFPGLDSLVDEVTKCTSYQARQEVITLLEQYNQHEPCGHPLDTPNDSTSTSSNPQSLDEILQLLKEQPRYEYNRKLLFRVLVMANSQLAELIKATGPNTQCNAACAGTSHAIAIADDWLRASRRCERVIVIASDVATSKRLLPYISTGFMVLGAGSKLKGIENAAAPFDVRRKGMIVGAGAVGLVLETVDALQQRCTGEYKLQYDHRSQPNFPFDEEREATSVTGVGSLDGSLANEMSWAPPPTWLPKSELLLSTTVNSAFHASLIHTMHVEEEMKIFLDTVELLYGERLLAEWKDDQQQQQSTRQRSFRQQLSEQLLYFSHETSTSSCAKVEINALRQYFSRHISNVVVCNTKGYSGHAMGVAFEDVIAVAALDRKVIPPIANLITVDPAFATDITLSSVYHNNVQRKQQTGKQQQQQSRSALPIESRIDPESSCVVGVSDDDGHTGDAPNNGNDASDQRQAAAYVYAQGIPHNRTLSLRFAAGFGSQMAILLFKSIPQPSLHPGVSQVVSGPLSIPAMVSSPQHIISQLHPFDIVPVLDRNRREEIWLLHGLFCLQQQQAILKHKVLSLHHHFPLGPIRVPSQHAQYTTNGVVNAGSITHSPDIDDILQPQQRTQENETISTELPNKVSNSESQQPGERDARHSDKTNDSWLQYLSSKLPSNILETTFFSQNALVKKPDGQEQVHQPRHIHYTTTPSSPTAASKTTHPTDDFQPQ